MDIYLDLDNKPYRLLQLTPQLEESLEKGELSIRNDNDHVNLCTSNSTHVLRKLKQSNTLMLLRPQGSHMSTFSSPTESLETIQVEPKVDFSQFKSFELKDGNYCPLRASLHAKFSPCSFAEFSEICRKKPVVATETDIFKVEPDLVHQTLVSMVSFMVENSDFELEKEPNFKEIAEECKIPVELVKSCYNMFLDDGKFNKDELSKWIALYLLQIKPSYNVDRFKREWSLDLPAKLPINFESLEGFVCYPNEQTIMHLDPESLPKDVTARFNKLFSIKTEWDLLEIRPFIIDLMPLGQRIDNWILKFAKKRKIGSKVIISRLRR